MEFLFLSFSSPKFSSARATPNPFLNRFQASLSLDYSVETVLLRNECDFISVEQGKESSRKKKQRDENIRQLLDVTNKTTLTTGEMRDFEMK